MIEHFVHKVLTLIQTTTKETLHTIPAISQQINYLNEYFKDDNHMLVSFMILIGFYFIYTILSSLDIITNLNTYTYFFYEIFKSCPFIKNNVNKSRGEFAKMCYESFKVKDLEKKYSINENGLHLDKIVTLLSEMSGKDLTSAEKISKQTGCIYIQNSDLDEIAGKALELYAYDDLMFPDVFPSAKRVEKNLIDILLRLFNAPANGCGLATTGGTESIITSMYAVKNFAMKRNIKNPEVILSKATHAAFDKAAQIFGLKLVKINLDKKKFNMCMKEVRAKLNENTVCIVGNATDFPHGLEDEICELSEIAEQRGILMHVDACLGGFLSCFHHEFNPNWKTADFLLKGVTSISVDVHKYGMTPKGTSLVLFRNKEIQDYISFGSNGCDGLYTTNTLGCSRISAFIASSLMVLIRVGRKAYVEQAKRIHLAIEKVKKDFKEHFPKLKILGNPQVSIFSFVGDKATQIHQEMKKKDWNINLIQDPIGVAFCITSANVISFENGTFFNDVKEAYEYVYKRNITSQSSMASIYGVAALLPESAVTQNMDVAVDCFIDSKEYLESLINSNKKENGKISSSKNSNGRNNSVGKGKKKIN